jgi:glutaredoxin
MEFESPATLGFTIYSKSGCPNCAKVKTYLKDKNLLFNVVDCDEYLIEAKEEFLTFIKNLAQKECRTFPMIFFDGKFIGGYQETLEYVEKFILAFEENISF